MAVVTQIQFRRDLAANWTSSNPTLAAGEFGYETDTGKAKIGNGSSTWTALSYALTGSAGTVTSVAGGTGLTGGTITTSGTLAIDTSVVSTLTGAQTLTNKTLTAPVITYTINAQTASYTPVLSDAAAIVTMNVGSANTFSIPTNASVAYAVGSQITVIQIGSGQTTIQAVNSGTTTIASVGGTSAAPKLRAQYSSATAIKVATDVWYVVGDIA
jgi:hypothetical protein